MNNADRAARAFEVTAARAGSLVGTALVTETVPTMWIRGDASDGDVTVEGIHFLVNGGIVRITESLLMMSQRTVRQLDGARRGDVVRFAIPLEESYWIEA
jgi:hypothetical protein